MFGQKGCDVGIITRAEVTPHGAAAALDASSVKLEVLPAIKSLAPLIEALNRLNRGFS